MNIWQRLRRVFRQDPPAIEDIFMDRRTLSQKVIDTLVDEHPHTLTNEQLAHRLDANMPSIRRVTLGLYNAGILTRHYTQPFSYFATQALLQQVRAERAAMASAGVLR